MKIVYERQEPITEEILQIKESEVGDYGTMWLEFMAKHHPIIYRQLKKEQTLYAIAQSVDNIAWDYRELLDHQYMELHPRPEVSFEKIAAWERTRAFYTDGAVIYSGQAAKRQSVYSLKVARRDV
jgi:hypothetical protein